MNGPSSAGAIGTTPWKIRSRTPSTGSPRVIGIRCGDCHAPDDTRPRARMMSRPPARSERNTSTLVTTVTGHGATGGGPSVELP